MAYSRDAIDTLRGYYYQFDYFVLKLLTAGNADDVITLEGMEDVDIQTATETTAVQCKYYAGTEYNHSIIAKPIRFMLKGFVSHVGAPLNYKLYGYYKTGTDKLSQPLTLDFVKKHFMTYTADKVKHEFHVDEGITDAQITDFISHLEINLNATTYEKQEKDVQDAIKATFNIRSKAEQQVAYYYNHALGLVRQICVEPNVAKRSVSKRHFVELLKRDAAETFDAWYLVKKGKDQYCRLMRSRYFTFHNVSPAKRFFLIDTAGATVAQIVKVIKQIKEKYAKFALRLDRPFCPYIYLQGISDADKNTVIKTLIEDRLVVKDGYEYRGADFNAQSLASNIVQDQRVDIKFLHTTDEMNQVLSLIRSTKQIYQFYIDNTYYRSVDNSDVQINITEINDIVSII